MDENKLGSYCPAGCMNPVCPYNKVNAPRHREVDFASIRNTVNCYGFVAPRISKSNK